MLGGHVLGDRVWVEKTPTVRKGVALAEMISRPSRVDVAPAKAQTDFTFIHSGRDCVFVTSIYEAQEDLLGE